MVLWVRHRSLNFLCRLVPKVDGNKFCRVDVHGGVAGVGRRDMVKPLGLVPPRGDEGR